MEKKYPLLLPTHLIDILQRQGSTNSLLGTISGHYFYNNLAKFAEFETNSRNLAVALTAIRLFHYDINQLNRKKVFIFKSLQDANSLPGSTEVIDLTNQPNALAANFSKDSNTQLILKTFGGNKEINKTDAEINEKNKKLEGVVLQSKVLSDNMRKAGVLLSGLHRGSIDCGLNWLHARDLGLVRRNVNHNGNLSKSFLFTSQRIHQKLVNQFHFLCTISGHMMNPAYCSIFDHTGRYLLTGADDYLVKIWDVQKGLLVRTCKGHQEYISFIAISPDNSLFASSCTQGNIRIWRLCDGVCLRSLNHTGTVNWLRFDTATTALVSGSDDGNCTIWDLTKLIPLSVLSNLPLLQQLVSEHGTTTTSLDLIEEDIEEVVAGGIFDWSKEGTGLASSKLTFPHVQQQAPCKVLCLDIAPTGDVIATGCDDGTARIWRFGNHSSTLSHRPTRRSMEVQGATSEIEQKYLLLKLFGHVSSVSDIQFNSLGDRLLTASTQDGSVRIWSMSKDYSDTAHIALDLTEEENTAPEQPFVRQRNRANHKPSFKLNVYNVCWTCDDTRVITIQNAPANETGTIGLEVVQMSRLKVWNSMTGELMAVLMNIGNNATRCLARHPLDSNIVMTGSEDGYVNVWNINRDLNLFQHRILSGNGTAATVNDISVSNDGTFIAATDSIGRVTFIAVTDPANYSNVYSEQYFSSDYSDMTVNEQGIAIDVGTQLLVHQAPVGSLCRIDGTPHAAQPKFSSSGPQPFSVKEVKDMLDKLRCDMLLLPKEMDRVFSKMLDQEKHPNRNVPRFTRAAKPSTSSSQGNTKYHTLANLPRSRPHNQSYLDNLYLEQQGLSPDENMIVDSEYEDHHSVESGGGQVQVRAQVVNGTRSRRNNVRTFADESPTSRRNRRRCTFRGNYNDALEENELGVFPTSNSSRRRATSRRNDHHISLESSSEDVELIDVVSSDNDNLRRPLRKEKESSRPKRGKKLRSQRNSIVSTDSEMELLDEEAEMIANYEFSDEEEGTPHRRNRENSRGAKASYRKKTPVRSSSSSSRIKEPIILGLEYDRKWMQEYMPNEFAYAPQIGDVVMYFPQGHKEYLQAFSENLSPPWNDFPAKYPVVECEVRNIEFDLPRGSVFARCNSIVATLTLVLLRIPAKQIISPNGQYVLDLAPPRTTRHTVVREHKFQVTLRKYRHLAEFIIPQAIFLRSIRLPWMPDIEVIMHYENVTEDGEVVVSDSNARVAQLSNSDVAWPNSPWGALEVVWSETPDGSSDRVNPWEVSPVFEAETIYSKEFAKFMLPKVELSEANRISAAIEAFMDSEPQRLDPFRYEIDSKVFVDYYAQVPLPMYVDLIVNRLHHGYYRQLEALEFDIHLIYRNCCRYNREDADIVKDASFLRDQLLLIVRPNVGAPTTDDDLLFMDMQPLDDIPRSKRYVAASFFRFLLDCILLFSTLGLVNEPESAKRRMITNV